MNSLWNARGTPSSRSRFGDFTMLRAHNNFISRTVPRAKRVPISKRKLNAGTTTSYVKIKNVRYPFFLRSPLRPKLPADENFFYLFSLFFSFCRM